MAKHQGQSIEQATQEPTAILNDLVILALPAALYRSLSDAAFKRNQTLSQFLSEAVSAALEKPLGPSLLTEETKR